MARRLTMELKPNNILFRAQGLSASTLKVFQLILKAAHPRTSYFFSTKETRLEIANRVGITDAGVRKCLEKLVKEKFLLRPSDSGRGVYEVNKMGLEIDLE